MTYMATRATRLAAVVLVEELLKYGWAEIGLVDAQTVAVTFTDEVEAGDYAAGVTIEVNGSAWTISSATRQADKRVVHYVISSGGLGIMEALGELEQFAEEEETEEGLVTVEEEAEEGINWIPYLIVFLIAVAIITGIALVVLR